MSSVIDSTLWVDYFRAKTPGKIKEQIVPIINHPESALCAPVRFEVLRAARRNERFRIEQTFATFPLLSTPQQLWERAIVLGQKCVDAGSCPPAMDLIIAQVCLANNAELVTFDVHFLTIAEISALRVRLLDRAAFL